ncbi:MAG: hypothetical protein IH628_09655, partial [Proteobacteria bacterium]|nr:hypothetical protein [Pseudomonadota bacterium]
MKILRFFLCGFFLIHLLTSCTDLGTDVAQPDSNATGGFSLNLPKGSIPADVAWVCVELSRPGELLEDSVLVGDVLDTVRFHLTALPVGRWDLVVSAKDSLFRVKSVGQATVEVRAGETTFVYVYMNPVLETGTIEIVIIWGKPSGRWTM